MSSYVRFDGGRKGVVVCELRSPGQEKNAYLWHLSISSIPIEKNTNEIGVFAISANADC